MSIPYLDKITYNLLIIDDEVEITKSIARQFRKKYQVFTAISAKEGMAIMEKEHIQVILSDQRMPDMTGVDFFSVIKDKYPDALKLLITGYSDIEAVIGAINEGQVFRYVTKPWNPDELESIVKEAFEKYELITNNRRLMLRLQDANQTLEQKVQERTSELEKANSHLSNLNQEKNRYIGMVAHDLRNPIGTAEAFSGLLLDNFDELSKNNQLEYIGLIQKSCSFSLDLIHEFLDISKIEAGIFDLNLSRLDYVGFLSDNVKRNAMLAKNKFQKLIVESTAPEISFNFDKNKIEQVLNNLIGNAMKYSMPNTEIKIEVSISNQMVITKVTDEGQGIPQDELELIFHPYKTSSTKATANEKSTGLGLAIVKKIIESHQGTVEVQSVIGKGSVFSFTLPL
jgi:signal transduction histidine kinase